MMEHNFRTTVARSPEEVFDFLVDLRNAPQWEPNCQEVEKTSDGPIGKGTTFRAKKGMGRLESEIVEFERPAHFATRDKGRGMSCGLDFRCAAKNGGTEVSGKLWMEPRGPLRGLMLLMRLTDLVALRSGFEHDFFFMTGASMSPVNNRSRGASVSSE